MFEAIDTTEQISAVPACEVTDEALEAAAGSEMQALPTFFFGGCW